MKTQYKVDELAGLSPLELLDASVSNRLPAHITVRALLTMVHDKLKQRIALDNQQIGRALRPRPSLGWVNAYQCADLRLRISSLPYKTKDEAEAAKASEPVSKYLGAMEVFGVVPRAYHADNCAALTPHDISPWLCNCGFEAQFDPSPFTDDRGIAHQPRLHGVFFEGSMLEPNSMVDAHDILDEAVNPVDVLRDICSRFPEDVARLLGVEGPLEIDEGSFAKAHAMLERRVPLRTILFETNPPADNWIYGRFNCAGKYIMPRRIEAKYVPLRCGKCEQPIENDALTGTTCACAKGCFFRRFDRRTELL